MQCFFFLGNRSNSAASQNVRNDGGRQLIGLPSVCTEGFIYNSFGITKSQQGSMGTLVAGNPEQASSNKTHDPPSDEFTLGCRRLYTNHIKSSDT